MSNLFCSFGLFRRKVAELDDLEELQNIKTALGGAYQFGYKLIHRTNIPNEEYDEEYALLQDVADRISAVDKRIEEVQPHYYIFGEANPFKDTLESLSEQATDICRKYGGRA